MAAPTTQIEDFTVLELITQLCAKTASQCCTQSGISQKQLISKMRSYAFEIILQNKYQKNIIKSDNEPITDLLSYYFVFKENVRNADLYKKCMQLKNIINTIRDLNFGDEDTFNNVLKFIIALKDTAKQGVEDKQFQPFTFGKLHEMLPRPHRESFGSPQPYPYFPSYVFELPCIKEENTRVIESCTDYSVQSPDLWRTVHESLSKNSRVSDLKIFCNPKSLSSLSSKLNQSPYSECSLQLPRLTTPRSINIPSNFKSEVSFPSSEENQIVPTCRIEINEIVMDDDSEKSHIWELVSKMPPTNERRLIESSSKQMEMWRRANYLEMPDLNIISERQFIRHIMYLVIGIETPSFPLDPEQNFFYSMKYLTLEGISQAHLDGYISELLIVGTLYRRLYKFAFNESVDDYFHTNGLIYEAARETIRQFLLDFRMEATKICGECFSKSDDVKMPTLLEIAYHMAPLKEKIYTVITIFKQVGFEKTPLPTGAELMSYIFKEISFITEENTAIHMFNSLLSICKVYFRFIEKFIFEGEIEDAHDEFFIRKDEYYVNCNSKPYWDRGFYIGKHVVVPEFIRPLSRYILLCGKSLRLLKLCNPTDPLVLLITSDHPSVKCCSCFEELEAQQRLLDVYRTRCLFVSGEPVTFDQILLKREAEKKAFTEMATMKQAETMEKIIAERKRLAQLIVVEKQHSLKVLEAAIAEAKAAKNKSRQRERKLTDLEKEAVRAREEVDSRLRDEERNKIMEYYSKLNIEVEKSKIHTEWKIKRLQLDQSRVQLLSADERNLKREKLELEHQKSEEVMATSLSCDDAVGNEPGGPDEDVKEPTGLPDPVTHKTNSFAAGDFTLGKPSENEPLRKKVFSVICNAAKHLFQKDSDDCDCDNGSDLDSQGNVVPFKKSDKSISGGNNIITKDVSPSKEFDANRNEKYVTSEFLKVRQEALQNKQKVMMHEFGRTDSENNTVTTPSEDVDHENNVQSTRDEAKANRNKVMSSDINTAPLPYKSVVPSTDAQKEAVLNREHIMTQKYNVAADAWVGRKPVTEAQEQAELNRKKVMMVEYNCPLDFQPPKTQMSTAGLLNREKIMNEVFNLPLNFSTPKHPVNEAQEEAIRNRDKMMGSETETFHMRPSKSKRAELSLDLKACSQGFEMSITPSTSSITPAQYFPRLDVETPTTAELPFETSTEVTSTHDLKRESFHYIMIDDPIDTETTCKSSDDTQMEEVTDAPAKNAGEEDSSFSNILDASNSQKDFDPFGLNQLRNHLVDKSMKIFPSSRPCVYTHAGFIMEEVTKKPYDNLLPHEFSSKPEEKLTHCDNIATLTACLQRSVMLPLTYQLEVVNNSILTHFLVNLDMYEHLRSLRDYFFLMDGEFSNSVCNNLFAKLERNTEPTKLLNCAMLKNVLDKAIGASISHVQKFSENVSFTISETPLVFQHSSPDVLQCLSLTYSVGWPLNIILSQEALAHYRKVFEFLLKMRRICWILRNDFLHLKSVTKLSRNNPRRMVCSPHYVQIQMYRYIMSSLIRALDNYIVTTCILTSWTDFEKDLMKARTLDDLYQYHVVYIKKVIFRCLLNNRSTPVMKLINDIFTLILKFSRVLAAGRWELLEPEGSYTHSNFVQLQALFNMFKKLAKYLHKVIVKLMDCGYQRHLVELLSMINLNGYYSDSDKEKQIVNESFG